MQYAFYNQYQFIDQTVLNAEQTQLADSFALLGAAFQTPGVNSPGSMILTPSGLIVTAVLSLPFGVQFSSGVYAQAHGLINGIDSQTYSLNFASSVPSSGSITVYAVAQAAQVNEGVLQVVGPPPGHTDYDPTFTPITANTLLYDTLNIALTTTPANNTTNIELFRTTLTAGQTGITSGQLNTANQILAGSVLTFANVISGLGYTPVNKAGDIMSGGLTISAAQSGVATASPGLELQAWTGSAGIFHKLFESSAGLLEIVNSTNGTIVQIDQSSNLYLESLQSGSAVNAPILYFYAWSGTANVKNYFTFSSGSVLTLSNTAGSVKFTSDNNNKFTSAGALAAQNNTLDDGSGNATFAGSVTISAAIGTANTLITTLQSGVASSSPTFSLRAWTGSAAAAYTLFTDSSGSLTFQGSGASALFSLDQSGQPTLNGQTIAGHETFWNVATNSFVQIKFPASGGSTDTNAVYWYRQNSDNTAFAVQINSTIVVFKVKSTKVVTTFNNILDDGFGNLTAVTLNATSSSRYKENIVPLKLGRTGLRLMNPVEYDRTSTGQHEWGFIAEEVMENQPFLVGMYEGHPNSLNYNAYVPWLTKVCQEQDEIIQTLSARVEALESHIRHDQ